MTHAAARQQAVEHLRQPHVRAEIAKRLQDEISRNVATAAQMSAALTRLAVHRDGQQVIQAAPVGDVGDVASLDAHLRSPRSLRAGAHETVAALQVRLPALAVAFARTWVALDERVALARAAVQDMSSRLDLFGQGELTLEALDAAGALSAETRDRAEAAFGDFERLVETIRLALDAPVNDDTDDS